MYETTDAVVEAVDAVGLPAALPCRLAAETASASDIGVASAGWLAKSPPGATELVTGVVVGFGIDDDDEGEEPPAAKTPTAIPLATTKAPTIEMLRCLVDIFAPK